jgi:hypothetical protein
MEFAIYILFVSLIVFLWLSAVVRLLWATFSVSSRRRMAERPVFHGLWFFFALLAAVQTIDLLSPRSGSHPLPKTPEGNAMLGIVSLEIASKAYYAEYGTFPTGDNVAVAGALQGSNPRKIVFIEFKSQDTNQFGEVIDPWGTPYKFELQNGKPPSIRSAGPNRVFGDKDDILVPEPESTAAKAP